MMPSPHPRSTRQALSTLQYGLGTVAPPNPLVFCWRWRYELILGIGLPAALIVLDGVPVMLGALAAMEVLAVAALVWAPTRHLIVRAWRIITPHRVRVGCAQVWIHSRRDKIPAVLTTRQPFAERVQLWCRPLLLITASMGRLLVMLPRLAISVLCGFLMAEPLSLRIFQPEINAQIAITQQQARLGSQIAALRTDASTLHSQEVAAEPEGHAAIAGGRRCAARGTVPDQLEARQLGVFPAAWVVRLAFVLVDLSSLIAKFLFGKQLCDEMAEAVRKCKRVAAQRLRGQAQLEQNMVAHSAGDEEEIDEANRSQQIIVTCADAQPGGQAHAARIQAINLNKTAQPSRIHEWMAVPTTPTPSRVAWMGAGLLAASALALMAAQAAVHVSISSGWLTLAALLAALFLTACSRGFHRSLAWAPRTAVRPVGALADRVAVAGGGSVSEASL